MEKEIKNSYKNIKMPEKSKEKIHSEILRSGAFDKKNRHLFRAWRVGLAACLAFALVIPTSVFAARKISGLFIKEGAGQYETRVELYGDKESASAEKTSKKDRKYIKVKADFGSDYTLIKDVEYISGDDGKVHTKKVKYKEGMDGTYNYAHKKGFSFGRDFYYDVLYIDTKKDVLLNLYNQASRKEITVNGHRALLCRMNTIQGSQYVKDHDSDYTIDLYVFYDEYGYVINFCGMQGLGEDALVSLAKKASVTESGKDKASRYELLSHYNKANMVKLDESETREKITDPVGKVSQTLKNDGFVYQVIDVSVSSKVPDMDEDKFDDNTKKSLWGRDGKLKPYTREKLQMGDGVKTPERRVVGTQKIQPKMVYVTMKVKSKQSNNIFCLPNLLFAEREGKEYYQIWPYENYNRPAAVEDAFMDCGPCYFKETSGGTGFLLKEMNAGEEAVYHFAYLVDEDMTDNMLLRLGVNPYKLKYIDLSK